MSLKNYNILHKISQLRNNKINLQYQDRGQYNKNMKQNRTMNKFGATNPYQQFVHQTKRNGYLQQVKQLTRNTLGEPNAFDRNYRKKVNAYYSKKLTKPFRLIDQPQFIRQLRFNQDFTTFVRSIPQFESIEQKPIYTMPEMTMMQKQVHSQSLLFNVQKKCDVSPENVEKRKTLSKKNQYNKFLQQKGIFSTKVNFTQNLKINKRIHLDQDSRIDINITSGARTNSIQKSSPKRNIKRLESMNKTLQASDRRINFSKSRKTNNSLSNLQVINAKQEQKKIEINTDIAIDNLNKLTGTEHKIKNYRIAKPKLHEILAKRYGQDIITNFFGLQAIEDFSGILKLVRQLLGSSEKLGQMLTFLTLDINQDGVITQDELISINNLIDVQNQLTQDINTLILYSKQRSKQGQILKYEPDLSPQFIKYPTYVEYLKMSDQNKGNDSGIKGIFRLFSFKTDEGQITGRGLPTLAQKNIDITKKQIRINFYHFQKAFEKIGHPKFIKQLVTFLLGKNYNKISKDEKEQSPRKVSLSNKKRGRKGTFSLEPKLNSVTYHSQQNQKISRAQQILKTMYQHTKFLSTVHYQPLE